MIPDRRGSLSCVLVADTDTFAEPSLLRIGAPISVVDDSRQAPIQHVLSVGHIIDQCRKARVIILKQGTSLPLRDLGMESGSSRDAGVLFSAWQNRLLIRVLVRCVRVC